MNASRRQFFRQAALGTAALAAVDCAGGALAAVGRTLFDGHSLAGWHASPRLYVPKQPRFDVLPSTQLREAIVRWHEEQPALRERAKNTGRWDVVAGAIVGGQVPETQLGGYLLSDATFGDFELTVEARPDWPIDTGIMVRAHELGSVGFQVLLDHRPGGAIGGVYGNSVGNFRAYPFNVDGDEQPGFRVANLRAGQPDGPCFKPDFAAPLEAFLKSWRPNDWNTFRIRCVGRLPVIETWINGVAIARLDTARLADRVPGYDAEAVLERLGRQGHIGFEVHDTGKMGRNRWAPGAVCRWRNIEIVEL